MREKTIAQPRILTGLLSARARPERALVPYPPTQPLLYVRYQAVVRRSRHYDLPVRYLGTMPIFTGHRVYPGRRYDWILVNLAKDPLLQDRDGFPVPARVLEGLRRIQKSGVDFDALYVAHEVPKGTISEEAALTAEMLLPPPPRAVQELSDRLGTIGRALWVLATLLVAGSAMAGGLMAAGTAGMLSVVGLDPILLGVIVALGRPVAPGEPAAWFYLGHWALNQEA